MISHDEKAAADGSETEGDFGAFVADKHRSGDLVVQPRMGFGGLFRMREGLLKTKDSDAATVGTLTLDSYTRVGDVKSAANALESRQNLNGYPLVTYGPVITRQLIDGIQDVNFPIQVRHGSASPQDIFRTLVQSGLSATEGGPLSYCFPYGRTRLRESIRNWQESCDILLSASSSSVIPHLETFGGCMMGQLCPPALLVAISVLEAMFFSQAGIRSVSLSYAQQTNFEQDLESLAALQQLAHRYLPQPSWHIVVYAYMGVFPKTPEGSSLLLKQAARLTVESGASRLIVKTAAEAFRIPSIADNIDALEAASSASIDMEAGLHGQSDYKSADNQIYLDARAIIESTLAESENIGVAILRATQKGLIDVPFCLHPDNAGSSTAQVGHRGRLEWLDVGNMAIKRPSGRELDKGTASSAGLLDDLTYVQRRFDRTLQGPAERIALPDNRSSAQFPVS
jgi:methylaspartate mutase epsilon subunit